MEPCIYQLHLTGLMQASRLLLTGLLLSVACCARSSPNYERNSDDDDFHREPVDNDNVYAGNRTVNSYFVVSDYKDLSQAVASGGSDIFTFIEVAMMCRRIRIASRQQREVTVVIMRLVRRGRRPHPALRHARVAAREHSRHVLPQGTWVKVPG